MAGGSLAFNTRPPPRPSAPRQIVSENGSFQWRDTCVRRGLQAYMNIFTHEIIINKSSKSFVYMFLFKTLHVLLHSVVV